MNPTTDVTQGRLRGILETGDFGVPCAELSVAALRVLESRYLLRDGKGVVNETPRQLFNRVAHTIAQVEKRWLKGSLNSREEFVDQIAHRFFEMISNLRFIPNSPTLMNAGRPKGQLSACFVLPIEDDLGKVFETLRDSAVIHKSGGGTGFNFGRLRPKGDFISTSGGRASGPIAFLKIFDQATQTVKQGGTRRGANMAILPVDHPDIEAFVDSKIDGGIENFNISVGVSDAFMKAVKDDSTWSLKNPRTKETVKNLKAKKLWKQIAESAWKSGDPGVVFFDRINEVNPTPNMGPMESTNPCGEKPLLAYESCNLGSINLLAYIKGKDFSWDDLERDIALAVRFLDNVIEANSYPLLAIEEVTMMNRKIGLGVMGWADVLLEWGIAYDSDEALKRAEKMMERLSRIAVKASEDLATERGAFPNFAKSLWAMRGQKPRRNATVTSIAPTGTISIIAGVSSGIEPVFSLAFERQALEGEHLVFIHPALKRALKESNVRSRRVLSKIIETGSVAEVKELPTKYRRVLKTAMEIRPDWHVKMQAAFQKYSESAVSKTINLPKAATAKEIQKVYELAYNLGCKGITVFRDMSKDTQVLRTGVGLRKNKRKDLLEAVDWLLDDESDTQSIRKRASVGLASLSRAQLKKGKRSS